MFLSLLNSDQFAAFIFLAKEFVTSDNVITDEEKSILERMARESIGSEKPERSYRSHEEAASTFDSKESRAIALLEIIGLAYADGEYRDEEVLYVKALADEFEIPFLTLAAMENWVLRQVALNGEAMEFIIDKKEHKET